VTRVAQPQASHLGKVKARRGLGNRTARAVKPADDAAEVARKERREQVARLRIQHSLVWNDIGRELGISGAQAYRDFDLWKDEQPPSPLAAQVRTEEEPKLLRNAQRLEVAMGKVLKRFATEGLDTESELACAQTLARLVEKSNKTSESRRRLHGADAPEQKEHAGPGGGPIPVAAAKVSKEEILAIIEANERKP
jgi:hypothetical protein